MFVYGFQKISSGDIRKVGSFLPDINKVTKRTVNQMAASVARRTPGAFIRGGLK